VSRTPQKRDKKKKKKEDGPKTARHPTPKPVCKPASLFYDNRGVHAPQNKGRGVAKRTVSRIKDEKKRERERNRQENTLVRIPVC